MLYVIGTVRMPAENLHDARSVMREMVEESLQEDGCEAYSYAEDVLEPGLIHVSEAWRDQDALDAHFASEHLEEWRANWGRLGIHDRSLWLIEADSVRQL